MTDNYGSLRHLPRATNSSSDWTFFFIIIIVITLVALSKYIYYSRYRRKPVRFLPLRFIDDVF